MLEKKKDTLVAEIKNSAVEIEVIRANIKKRRQTLNLDNSFASDQTNTHDETRLDS